MTWTEALVTVAVGVLGAGAALLGSGLQMRHATRERQAREADAQRDRVSKVVGPVETLLADLQPARIAPHISVPLMQDLIGRWRALRDELAVLAFAEPAPLGNIVFMLSMNMELLVNEVSSLMVGRVRPEEGIDEAKAFLSAENLQVEAMRRVVEIADHLSAAPDDAGGAGWFARLGLSRKPKPDPGSVRS